MPEQVNIEAVRSRISVINSQVAKINDTRSVNLGRKQTLESQFNSQVERYKQLYGVDITKENINAEVEAVTAEVTEVCDKLDKVLGAINSGDYTTANSLLGIEPAVAETKEEVKAEEPKEVAEPVPTPPQVSAPSVSVEPPVMPQVTQTTPPVAPTMPVMPPQGNTPVAPPMPNVGTPVSAPPQMPNMGAPISQTSMPVMPPQGNTPVAPPQMPVGNTPVAPQMPVGNPPQPQIPGGVVGNDFMNGVADTDNNSPMAAFAGFTKGNGLSGLDMPNLDVAPTTAPPTAPVTEPPMRNFSDLLGGLPQ